VKKEKNRGGKREGSKDSKKQGSRGQGDEDSGVPRPGASACGGEDPEE